MPETRPFTRWRLASFATLVLISSVALVVSCENAPSGPATPTPRRFFIVPGTPTVPAGDTVHFSTQVELSDGTVQNVLATYTATGGSITPLGSFTSELPGFYTIRARAPTGDTTTTNVTVTQPVLRSLSLTPSSVTLDVGQVAQFKSTGTFSNGKVDSIPASYSATGGTITSTGRYTAGNTAGNFRVIARDLATGLADTSAVIIKAPTLLALRISPKTATLQKRGTQQFSVTSTWSDGGSQDNGAHYIELVYRATGGTITDAGLYTAGIDTGTYVVIGRDNDTGKEDTARVRIAPATVQALVLTPDSVQLEFGRTQTFRWTANLSDGTQSRPAVQFNATGGSISNDSIYTAGSTVGRFMVTAVEPLSGKADTSIVVVVAPQAPPPPPPPPPATLVSIALTPDSTLVEMGKQQQFTIASTFSDGTHPIVAVNYNATGGIITPSGLYTAGNAPGTYRLIAIETTTGKADTAKIVIPPRALRSIALTPDTVSVRNGLTHQFAVNGIYSDNNTDTVTVDYSAPDGGAVSVSGLFTAPNATGTYRVIARARSAAVADTSTVRVYKLITQLVLSPADTTIATAEAKQFRTAATYSDGAADTASVDFAAPDGGTVSAAGLFTAPLNAGVYRVVAAARNNPAIADTSSVTVVRVLRSIELTPDTISIQNNATKQLDVEAYYTDNSTGSVAVDYSAPDGGSVDANGLFTAPNTIGVYRVIARARDGVAADTSRITVYRVLTSLQLSPADTTIATNETAQLRYAAAFSDGANDTLAVDYSTLDGGAVSASGLFTAPNAAGTYRVVIRAHNGTLADTAVVRVLRILRFLTLSPDTASIQNNATKQFSATGHYSDNATDTVSVDYTSPDSGSVDANGLFTAPNTPGSYRVIAKLRNGALADTSRVTVYKVLNHLEMTPADTTIATNETKQFRIAAFYSDGGTDTLTVDYTAPDGGTVSAVGLFTAPNAAGSYRVVARARNGTIADTSTVTVLRLLRFITLTPDTASIQNSTTKQFTASGHYSDNAADTVTVDYIAPDGGSVDASGLFTAPSTVGAFRVVARVRNGTFADTSTVKVYKVLAQLELAPADTTIATDETKQLRTTAFYSDGATDTLTVDFSAPDGGAVTAAGLFTPPNIAGSYRVVAKAHNGTPADTSTIRVLRVLRSITLSPDTASIQNNTAKQFTASGRYSDGVSDTVTVDYSAPDGGSADAKGLFTAPNKRGTYRVIAKVRNGSFADTSTVTVYKVLTNLTLTPADTTIATNETKQFRTSATYSDGGTDTLTVDFSTDGGSVDAAGLFTAPNTAGTYHVIAKGRNGTLADTSTITVLRVLRSIALTPDTASIQNNTTKQFSATGRYSDNVTDTASVDYSAPDGGTVDAAGLFTAPNTPGSYRVVAIARSGAFSDTSRITVYKVLTRLELTPADTTIATNDTVRFQPKGYYSDASSKSETVSYTLPDGGTIDSTGLFTAPNTEKTYHVIATQLGGNIADTATVHVKRVLRSITLSPDSAAVQNDSTQQFIATGHYSDNTSQPIPVRYTATGGTIDSTGLYTAPRTLGEYQVIATVPGDSMADTVKVRVYRVLQSIELTPADVAVATNETVRFQAKGHYSDTSTEILTVNYTLLDGGAIDSTGLFAAPNTENTYRVVATQLGGTIADTATVHVKRVLRSITLSPDSAAVQNDSTQQFTATGHYSDNTSQPTAVRYTATGGTIDSTGLYKAPRTLGEYQVIATVPGDSMADTVKVRVYNVLRSIELTPSDTAIATNEAVRFQSVGHYSDSSSKIETVSYTLLDGGTIDSTGLFIAPNAAATYRVVATQPGGTIADTATVNVKRVLRSVTLSPDSAAVQNDSTEQFSATGHYSDNTSQPIAVTYTATGGTIDSAGLYKAPRILSTYQVIATVPGDSMADTVKVRVYNVLRSIELTPFDTAVATNEAVRFQSVGHYSDSSSKIETVSYTLLDGGTIDSTGLFTAPNTENTYRVVATQRGGTIADTATVHVKRVLRSIALSPDSAVVQNDSTQQFAATGHYSDNTSQPIAVKYTATGGTIDSTGLYKAPRTLATYQVIATVPGDSMADTVNVRIYKVLERVELTPSDTAVATNETVRFQATGHYSDLATDSVTVSYTLLDGGTIDSTGLFTAPNTENTYRVVATQRGGTIADTATVHVKRVLRSITLTPDSAAVQNDSTQQFTATGHYSDNTSQLIATRYTATGGTIDSTGLYKAPRILGTYQVIASVPGDSMADTVSVRVYKVLQSVELTPADTAIATNETVRFHTNGHYSDSSADSVTVSYTLLDGGTIDSTGLFTAPNAANTYRVVATQRRGIIADTAVVHVLRVLRSIALTPDTTSIQNNNTKQFSVSGHYSDNSDDTVSVAYTAPDSGSVDASGMFTAPNTPGTYRVIATAKNGAFSDTSTVTVYKVLTRLELTPADTTIATNETKQLRTTAFYSDGGTDTLSVDFSSPDSGTVSATGLYTAPNTAGTYHVIAKARNATIADTSTITVLRVLRSITLSPDTASIQNNTTKQFSVNGHYSDNTTDTVTVDYTAPDSGSVDAAGLFTAPNSTGTYRVIATARNGAFADTSTVTVYKVLTSLTLAPADTTIATDETKQFRTTAIFSDGAADTLTVDFTAPDSGSVSASGLFTPPKTAGAYRVIATARNHPTYADTSTVTVLRVLRSVALTPDTASIQNNTTTRFSVTGRYSDNTTDTVTVDYAAPDSGSVDANGLFTAPNTPGRYRVIATVRGGTIADTSLVTVYKVLTRLELAPTDTTIATDETKQFRSTAFYSDGGTDTLSVDFSTPDSGTVSATGVFTPPNTAGTYRVVAKARNHPEIADTSLVTVVRVLRSITLAPDTVSLQNSTTHQFTVVGNYSDQTTDTVTATYAVADSGSITAAGLFTAPNTIGSYRVIASAQGGAFADTSVVTVFKVLTRLELAPADTSIATNESKQFRTTAFYSDGGTDTLTVDFTAPDSGIVSAAGLYTAPNTGGTYRVIATAHNNAAIADTSSVIVNRVLRSIALTPDSAAIQNDSTTQFSVAGHYSDNTTDTVTVDYATPDGGTVDSTGVFTAPHNIGAFRIVATVRGGTIADTSSVRVYKVLASVTLTPNDTTIATNDTLRVHAAGNYSDSSVDTVTVDYAALDGGTVDSTGRYVAPNTVGTYHVVASHRGGTFADTSTINVIRVLRTISLTPDTASVQNDSTKQFAVTGHYSDNTPDTVTVDYRAPDGGTVDTTGLFTAPRTPGAYRIVATVRGGTIADTSHVTVFHVLTSLTLSPDTVTALGGLTTNFSVAALFSDSSTAVLVDYSAPDGGRIDSAGVYTAPDTAGTFRIVATHRGGTFADTALVRVLAITNLSISPQVTTVFTNAQQPFQVTATLSDSSQLDVTNRTVFNETWSGGVVSNAGVFRAGVEPGTAYMLIASFGSKSDTSEIRIDGSTYAGAFNTENWNYASNADIPAGYFGWVDQGGRNVMDYVRIMPDTSILGYPALNQNVAEIVFPLNDSTATSTTSGSSPRIRHEMEGRYSDVWLHWTMKFKPGWTTDGPDQQSNNSYKIAFFAWAADSLAFFANGGSFGNRSQPDRNSAVDERMELEYGNTYDYVIGPGVQHGGRQMPYAEVPLPGATYVDPFDTTRLDFGGADRDTMQVGEQWWVKPNWPHYPSLAWHDGEWYEFIMHYKKTGPQTACYQYFRRKLTTAGVANPNEPWIYVAFGMDGRPDRLDAADRADFPKGIQTPRVGAVHLGVNRNQPPPIDPNTGLPYEIALYWGPWQLVDGTQNDNPFNVPQGSCNYR